MLIWEIRDENGKCHGTEFCPGNAAEHEMVLSEMFPEKTFTINEIDEVEGA